MVDDKVVSIQTLVFSVALSISQHVKEILGRLGWPSTLGGLPRLALGVSTNTTVKPPEIKEEIYKITSKTNSTNIGSCRFLKKIRIGGHRNMAICSSHNLVQLFYGKIN